MTKFTSLVILIVFTLISSAATDAEAKKCSNCKKSSKNSVEKEMDRIRAEQEAYAKNVRSLYNIVEDRDLRQKLRVSQSQSQKLDELERRYNEICQVIRNDRTVASSPEEKKYRERMKQEKLRELSLKAGLKVMDILSKDQVNAYGRHVEMKKASQKSR